MKSPLDQKTSDLLTKEENDSIFRLLGNKCQSLVTAVIQLYQTHPPDHSQWYKRDTGVICFVKDNLKRNYFFRLYCLNRRMMIWEQELYNSLEYRPLTEFFHSFEAEDGMVGLNFAKEEEAYDLRRIVNDKLQMKRVKREERKSRMQHKVIQQSPKPAAPSIMLNDSFGQQNQHHHQSGKKNVKRRHLTKHDISLPSDFRHVSHVGWDPNKGFDIDNVEDPQLKQFLNEAGVSDKQLRDKETRDFIYDFINKHTGMQVSAGKVENEPNTNQGPRIPLPKTPNETAPSNNPPPVPARSTVNRSAPPPPPSSKSTPKPPPVIRGQPPPRPAAVPKVATEPPQQLVNNAPPPPPPPPMGRLFNETSSGPPPPPPPSSAPSSLNFDMPRIDDARSNLLKSIQMGTTLKPVEPVEQKLSVGDSRGNLLNEIRQGISLKPVTQDTQKPQSLLLNDTLANALSKALKNRAMAIHSDSDDGEHSMEEEDDEWDD